MLPYLFIFVYELVKAGIVLILPGLTRGEAAFYFFLLNFLQIFSAPIQGAISDHYCRKKSMVVSFVAIALSQCLFFGFKFYGSGMLLAGILVLGVLGNAEVIARALLLDKYPKYNRRGIISASFVVQMIPWAITAFLMRAGFSIEIFLWYFIISLLCVILGIFCVHDRRDLDRHKKFHRVLRHDWKATISFLKVKGVLIALIAYFLYESSFSLSFYYQDEVIKNRLAETMIMILMVVGFIAGTILLISLKLSDKKGVLSGLLIGIVGYVVIWVLSLQGAALELQGVGYFILALGLGVTVPAIFTYFSLRQELHQQGKLFGILDSVHTIGEMAVTAILLYAAFVPAQVMGIFTIALYLVAFFLYKKGLLNAISSKRN